MRPRRQSRRSPGQALWRPRNCLPQRRKVEWEVDSATRLLCPDFERCLIPHRGGQPIPRSRRRVRQVSQFLVALYGCLQKQYVMSFSFDLSLCNDLSDVVVLSNGQVAPAGYKAIAWLAALPPHGILAGTYHQITDAQVGSSRKPLSRNFPPDRLEAEGCWFASVFQRLRPEQTRASHEWRFGSTRTSRMSR